MNAAVAAWVEATRRRQGLPPRVENPAALDQIAAILVGARVEGVAVDAKAS
jgi:hypothetical protein